MKEPRIGLCRCGSLIVPALDHPFSVAWHIWHITRSRRKAALWFWLIVFYWYMLLPFPEKVIVGLAITLPLGTILGRTLGAVL